jgi:hypothetical protein
MSAVLENVDMIGPFFAAEVHEARALAAGPWRPMSELTRGAESLEARIDGVRVALAQSVGRRPEDIEPRVAASVTHLGLVARLLSPALGAAAGAEIVPDLALETAWWQPVLGGPFPLCLPASGRETPQGAHALLAGPIRELTEAVAGRVSVSPRVLWGNVASAVNSACTVIGAQRPALGTRAATLAGELLERPPLDGTATGSGAGFRRRSCCLIYRLAPGSATSVCGDCILRA